jgi:peptidoglycan/xylan/chitin deacetylase (PgdA/CDA1 family)
MPDTTALDRLLEPLRAGAERPTLVLARRLEDLGEAPWPRAARGYRLEAEWKELAGSPAPHFVYVPDPTIASAPATPVADIIEPGSGSTQHAVSRPWAVVSVDVDPVDLHLIGYGHRGLPPDPLAYTVALPRLVDAFARWHVRATFFVVGRDAAPHATVLRELARAGHEVASHSMSHPMPLAGLDGRRLDAELVESKRALESVTGDDVQGFRAPNWDVSSRVLERLAAAGYRYDASLFPSLLLIPARLLLALKARNTSALSMRPWPVSLVRRPRRQSTAAGPIAVLPISVTPRLQFPLYHTTRYLMGTARFRRQLDGVAARSEPFFYPLHAVDALGLTEDRVDERLARHPGMERALEAKRRLRDESLAMIAERFEPVTYREYVERAGLLT